MHCTLFAVNLFQFNVQRVLSRNVVAAGLDGLLVQLKWNSPTQNIISQLYALFVMFFMILLLKYLTSRIREHI